jgi:hypothetical protein
MKDNIVTQPYEQDGVLYCKCGNDQWTTKPNSVQECTKCKHTVKMVIERVEQIS